MAIKFLHQRRPARRVVLWTLGTFALLQLAVDVVLDGWRPDLRSPHLARALAQMDECASDVGMVCLGTSRFGIGVNASLAQDEVRRVTGDDAVEVFSTGISAGDLNTMDYLLAQVLDRGWRPGLVVMELCPEMVNRHNPLIGIHVMPRLSAETLLDYPGDLWRSRKLQRVIRDRWLPVYTYRRSLVNEWSRLCAASPTGGAADASPKAGAPGRSGRPSPFAQIPSREELFLMGGPNQNVEEAREEGLARVRHWLGNYEVGGLTCRALERMLTRCREHHARAVLLAPPVCRDQCRLYTPAIEAAFQRYVQDLRRRYDCQFLDFRQRLPDVAFFDNHHMRAGGAIAFTEDLTKDVLVPFWSQVAKRPGLHQPDSLATLPAGHPTGE